MNKTLYDYEGLKRGDWVKFHDGWQELDRDPQGVDYFFRHVGRVLGAANVEAVLRPSVIIRDQLDDKLSQLRNGNQAGFVVRFEEIHPKKEEKSLILRVAEAQKTHNEPGVLNALTILCDEVSSILKRLERLEK
jgi:hypothetical protein